MIELPNDAVSLETILKQVQHMVQDKLTTEGSSTAV